MICERIIYKNILNEPELICLRSILETLQKSFKHSYLAPIILFNINFCLHTVKWFQVLFTLIVLLANSTGLQRNWGKHKNTCFYLIWGCCIQIWNPFLLITSSFFLDMHSVHFVHIRYIKAYMNSGLILIFWVLWLIF